MTVQSDEPQHVIHTSFGDIPVVYDERIPPGHFTLRPPIDVLLAGYEFGFEINIEEGVMTMGLRKHGTGEILPEPDEDQKTAAKQWTEEDEEALREENED